MDQATRTPSRLRAVEIPGVREEWPRVRDWVAEVAMMGGYMAEDVYHALLNGTATLFIAENPQGGDYLGCFVFEVLRFPIPVLNVWVGYSTGVRDIVAEVEPDVLALARQLGLKKVQFVSPRKGWERKMSKRWRAVAMIWEQEV